MVLSVFIPQYEHVLVSIFFIPVSNIVHVDGFEVSMYLQYISNPSVFDRLKSCLFLLSRLSLANDRTATVLVHDVFLIDLLL